ncbi:MAG: hypothetical protein HQ567_24215 [Candidatus Nealsonbacteria bacterium]|nr:hypothetical protein [Candidatus Nealsonbacteria bacterium]
MRKFVRFSPILVVVLWLGVLAEQGQSQEAPPWAGNYCMSLFVKTRTAKTVGKDHLSLSFKSRWAEYDQRRNPQGEYDDLVAGDSYRRRCDVVCAKYGWAEDHHLAIGVPFLSSDYHVGATDIATHGLGNVFVFEKWNPIKETYYLPAVAFDAWVLFPTGDSAQKRGSSDCSVRFTMPVSKTWEHFSLHFHPGYQANCGDGPDILDLNGSVIFTPTKKSWPAIEYNYMDRDGKGVSHDFVPGFIWKYTKGASVKLAAVISADTNMSFRDEVGVVGKVFFRF